MRRYHGVAAAWIYGFNVASVALAVQCALAVQGSTLVSQASTPADTPADVTGGDSEAIVPSEGVARAATRPARSAPDTTPSTLRAQGSEDSSRSGFSDFEEDVEDSPAWANDESQPLSSDYEGYSEIAVMSVLDRCVSSPSGESFYELTRGCRRLSGVTFRVPFGEEEMWWDSFRQICPYCTFKADVRQVYQFPAPDDGTRLEFVPRRFHQGEFITEFGVRVSVEEPECAAGEKGDVINNASSGLHVNATLNSGVNDINSPMGTVDQDQPRSVRKADPTRSRIPKLYMAHSPFVEDAGDGASYYEIAPRAMGPRLRGGAATIVTSDPPEMMPADILHHTREENVERIVRYNFLVDGSHFSYQSLQINAEPCRLRGENRVELHYAIEMAAGSRIYYSGLITALLAAMFLVSR